MLASALSNREFVTQAILELKHNWCVVKVPSQLHICSSLSVVSNRKGKQNLVINLCYLNEYLWKDKFKYEDLRIPTMYFHLTSSHDTTTLTYVFELHRQFLGFCWEQGGTKQFYKFTVLPFGLATACYTFTKLLRHLGSEAVDTFTCDWSGRTISFAHRHF